MGQGERMNRDQFFEKVKERDAEQLRNVLWNLYWRAGAELRQRIEAALEPAVARERRKAAADEVDPFLGIDVEDFVRLARSGAYMGGSREVSRQQRTKWRVTFRKVIDGASRLVASGDLEDGAPALEALLDLANDARGHYVFHTEDAVGAMKLVFSDRVALLWRATLDRNGFAAFASCAGRQLIRWESRFGWTSSGFGELARRETSLARVLAGMLRGLDTWIAFADAYLVALDSLMTTPPPPTARGASARRYEAQRQAERQQQEAERRAERLAEIHALVLDRLRGTDGEDRLERIAKHPALAGPELDFYAARFANARGQLGEARRVISTCLRQLPGHRGFLDLAAELGVAPPERVFPRRAARSGLAGDDT